LWAAQQSCPRRCGGSWAGTSRHPPGIIRGLGEISPGVLDRFSKDKGPVRLTLVEPVVVEVSADVAWSVRSFRHQLRFLRVRPELHPDEISSALIPPGFRLAKEFRNGFSKPSDA
jgi:hypothetical protein